MNNIISRIQLIDDPQAVAGTSTIGYLDIAESVKVPVTYSAADIRDLTKRTGTFSKTIILPGTKNNNTLLSLLFDCNIVTGTFNINKLQHCILLQNNIPILRNAYVQLVAVRKSQNGLNEDESVTYEVVVKDNIGDFFTQLGQKELTDLDFTVYDHVLSAAQISSTFNHTVADGYKYLMPWTDVPSAGAPTYTLNDFKPAIYAKTYWDGIHASAGFSYDWSTLSNNQVQFDKLLIPFNGDDRGATTATNNITKVIADRTGQPVLNIAPALNQPVAPLKGEVSAQNEIQDLSNLYSPIGPAPVGGSVYNVPGPLAAPNGIDFTFTVNFRITMFNTTVAKTKTATSGNYRPEIIVYNRVTGAELGIAPLAAYVSGPNSPGQNINLGTTNIYPTQTVTSTVTVSGFVGAEQLGFKFRLNTSNGLPPQYQVGSTIYPSSQYNSNILVNSFKVTANLNTQASIYFGNVALNDYVPKKIKQSDFIKSICQMYNLFVEIDPDDSNKLIYKHRDQFYDSGVVVDWTHKLNREEAQSLQFLPELSKKRLLLKYKDDKDFFNSLYQNTYNETYGQQEVIFDNNYVKDIDKKELIFSPTPMMETYFGAVAPLIDGKGPANNIRILLDNMVPGAPPTPPTCGPYTIQNYVGNEITLQNYPFLSHLNATQNPSFDINFGVCEEYFYDIGNFTNTNLYNLFWRRTMGQINAGKMLTAMFNLHIADIQAMKLNDKIRIDNSYWNINKIIDYDANSTSLTRVELISIDSDLKLPRFGKYSRFEDDWVVDSPQAIILPAKPNRGVLDGLSKMLKSNNSESSVINSTSAMTIYGRGNIIGPDFSGIIVGDNRSINQPGAYVSDYALTADGLIITGLKIIDAGADAVLPIDKTDVIDIIDGGLDSVRRFGGVSRLNTTRVYIDGGTDAV